MGMGVKRKYEAILVSLGNAKLLLRMIDSWEWVWWGGGSWVKEGVRAKPDSKNFSAICDKMAIPFPMCIKKA